MSVGRIPIAKRAMLACRRWLRIFPRETGFACGAGRQCHCIGEQTPFTAVTVAERRRLVDDDQSKLRSFKIGSPDLLKFPMGAKLR